MSSVFQLPGVPHRGITCRSDWNELHFDEAVHWVCRRSVTNGAGVLKGKRWNCRNAGLLEQPRKAISTKCFPGVPASRLLLVLVLLWVTDETATFVYVLPYLKEQEQFRPLFLFSCSAGLCWEIMLRSYAVLLEGWRAPCTGELETSGGTQYWSCLHCAHKFYSILPWEMI